MTRLLPIALILSGTCAPCGAPVRCSGESPPRAAPRGTDGQHAPLGATPAARWTVDGETYDIQSTYGMVIDGDLMFVVEWNLPPEVERPSDDATAMRLARPLMDHVLEEGLHEQTSIRGPDGELEVEYIGVALQKRLGPRTTGYRVRERVSALTAPGSGAAPPASAPPPKPAP